MIHRLLRPPTGRRLRPLLAIPLSLSLLAAGAPAGDLSRRYSDLDELSLEALLSDPIVETMTLRAQRSGEVPGTIVAFSGEELRRHGFATIRDALPYVLGADTDLGPEQVVYTFRELSDWLNNRVLFLVDGFPMNDPATGGSTTQLGFPIEEIRQLEIVLGPGSALYGANAFSGVINILTWDGTEHKGFEVAAGIGSEPLSGEITKRLAHVAYSSGPGETSWRISGAVSGLRGSDPINRSANPYALEIPHDGNADSEVGHLRGNLRHGATTVSIDYHRFDSGTPGLSFSPTPKDRRIGDTFASTVEREIYADGSHRFLGRAVYQHYSYGAELWGPTRETVDAEFLASGEGTILIDIRDGQTLYVLDPRDGLYHEADDSGQAIPGGEVLDPTGATFLVPAEGFTRKNDTTNPYDQGIVELRLQSRLGGRGSATFALEGTWASGSPDLIGGSIRTRNLAAYGQADWRIAGWTLLAGGRIDQHSEYGAFYSPRASVVWRPRFGTVGKLSYSRAFRAPTTLELHADFEYQNMQFNGNPDLDPESITAWEAGIGQSLGRRFRLGATGFHYRLHDAISTIGITGDRYFLLPEIYGKDVSGLVLTETGVAASYVNSDGRDYRTGFELELEGALGRGYRSTIGFAWTEVERQAELVNVIPDSWERYRTTTLLGRLQGPAPGGRFHLLVRVPSETPSDLEKEAASQTGYVLEDEPFYRNFEQTDLSLGYEHRRGPLSISIRGQNLLGRDETIVNLSGLNIGTATEEPWYRVDYKPTWYLKVGWNE
ncbi:MAG: TonB-dependent receptor [Candidatus Eisenbacteria bacterium]|nr:TonB-dependent receptor [Candidatus Latescibacterota bacterium]MBD3301789.1 TonB-dependent receptor [Candidatus Eisenbacteria bacterium]